MRLLAIALIMCVGACSASAPGSPDWQADVRPVVASNCVRCHGSPQLFGAPTSFRLDTYWDTYDPVQGVFVRGGGVMMDRMEGRVADGSMPPIFPLVGDDEDIIHNWARSAIGPDSVHELHGQIPPMTAPRPGNHAPTIAVSAGADPGTLAYQIDDVDFDLVYGELLVGDVVIARDLHNGRGTVAIDTSLVPDGTGLAVDARLDDGTAAKPDLSDATLVRGVATIDVTGNGATPIDVGFATPGPWDLFAATTTRSIAICGNQPGLTVTTITANDPRGGGTPVTLFGAPTAPVAVPMDTTIPTETVEPVPGGAETPPHLPCPTMHTAIAFDPMMLAAPDGGTSSWVLTATVTDGTHTITKRSPVFRVSHAAASAAFSTVATTFNNVCSACHYDCGPFPNMAHDWTVANGSATAKCGPTDGVLDANNVGLIYDRVVVRQDMPPPGNTPLTDADRAALASWLLGAAP